MALARTASHVFTIEIDPQVQAQAIANVEQAGLVEKVTFLQGDAMNPHITAQIGPIDSSFLDPDWAVTGPDHVYRFCQSNTQPPADKLLERVLSLTGDVGLVLPPQVDRKEFGDLPPHELQKMYLGGSFELSLLYFGELPASLGDTEFHAHG
jgi:hypothetical protein